MKKLLLALTLLAASATTYAFPNVTITAPVQILRIGQITTVTFTFSEAVTGFDLTDVHLNGNAQFTTVLTGSGTSYSVGVQKLVDENAVAVLIDNRSYTSTADSSFGIGSYLGFDAGPPIYIKQGGTFNGQLILASPRPTCPKAGEILVDNLGNPSSPVIEPFFIKRPIFNKKAYNIEEIKRGCLARLVNGQKYVIKVNPKDYELRNVHGSHNNMTMMPKIAQKETVDIIGTNKMRVKVAKFANLCTPASPDVQSCGASGDFRTGGYAFKIDNDDPIVYPGIKGAAHMHAFTGNTSTNYQSNAASMQKGASTMYGGALNRNGLWFPLIVKTETATALMPVNTAFYYKVGSSVYNEFTEPLPKGLKVIWGDPKRKPSDPQGDSVLWSCLPYDGLGLFGLDGVNGLIPECNGKSYRVLRVFISSDRCFKDDGTGKMMLDSPDHRSHAQPAGYVQGGGVVAANGCGALYPHRTQHVEALIDYPIAENDNTKTWRLSSDNYDTSLAGGASAHFDYWVFWNSRMIARINEQCNKTPIDCHTDQVGLSDPFPISSITTSGNIATVTTPVPHLLTTGTTLPGRISAVTGTSAASYNADLAPLTLKWYTQNPNRVLPTGTQGLTVISPTQFTYTLNSTPASTVIGVTNATYQVDEELCDLKEGDNFCPQAYADYSLRNYAE